MRAGAARAPLLGLFRALLAQGVPLGVRDWLDALRALEKNAGRPDVTALHRLALALWARNDDERRLIDGWFDALPAPESALLSRIDALLDAGRAAAGTIPRTSGPVAAANASGRPRAGDAASAPDVAAPAERARVSICDAEDSNGAALPRVQAAPPIAEEPALDPPVQVGARDMAVLWRRLRRAARRGASTELDLEATVRRRCEEGVLRAPVRRPQRANSARVLVLADAGDTMAPWRPLLQTLRASLPAGGFADSALRWFIDVPGDELYRDEACAEPEAAAALMRRFEGAALLIVSDVGSARGLLDRRRAARARAFVARWAPALTRVVWLNPMPEDRWRGTSAALVAADPQISCVALGPGALLGTIDLLRGQ
jgi:uncharacterized protein